MTYIRTYSNDSINCTGHLSTYLCTQTTGSYNRVIGVHVLEMGQKNLTVKYLAPMWTTQLFRRVQLSTNTYVIHYTELVTNYCCQVLIGGLLHNYQVSANQCTIYALYQYLYAASVQQVAQCKQKSRSLILSLIINKCNHQLTYTVVAVLECAFQNSLEFCS